MERNLYLSLVAVETALERIKERLDRGGLIQSEKVPSQLSAGRVTSAPVYAACSSPTYHSSAMDGIAVKAETTFSAREGEPLKLRRGIDYTPVNTGNPLPEGADAVIMVEHLLREDEEGVEIEAPAFPWQHVRRIGEDIVATELLYPQNHMLSAYDVGVLLSAGIWEVDVWETVRVHCIPTGDEVLSFRDRPEPKSGQVIESNSQVLLALLNEWGAVGDSQPPVADDPDLLAQALEAALDSDAHIVVIGAGSSAGSKDFTRAVIEQVGEVLVHGLTIMPGKPSVVGLARGKLIVGSPGYPVSAIVCYERILEPVLAWLGRRPAVERTEIEATLTRKAPSKAGLNEVVRLAVGRVGEKYVATPLARGAGMLTTLTKAQGYTDIPAASEGVVEGVLLPVTLLRTRAELEQTLVVVGSHDNTLDLLANELMGRSEPIRLASTHVGSMGGLRAIKNGSALVAGTHLFDPLTGDYNFPFIDKYLPDISVQLVNLAIRHQGLLVPKGNPKGIQGVRDLLREDVVYINRQRGAGTRILFDYHLQQENITPDQVQGYDKEEYTHMAVAVNVLSGAADCGMGIFAAAKALDLDFIPLARERYDLLFRKELADPKLDVLLSLLRDKGFQERIATLGGYEIPLTGQLMHKGQGLKSL